MSKEEVAIPTVAPQAVLLSSTVDAYERWYVVTSNTPNAFMYALIDSKPGDPRSYIGSLGISSGHVVQFEPKEIQAVCLRVKG